MLALALERASRGVTHGTASSRGVVWELSRSSRQRLRGWTSADAAGLPVFAGLVPYRDGAPWVGRRDGSSCLVSFSVSRCSAQ